MATPGRPRRERERGRPPTEFPNATFSTSKLLTSGCRSLARMCPVESAKTGWSAVICTSLRVGGGQDWRVDMKSPANCCDQLRRTTPAVNRAGKLWRRFTTAVNSGGSGQGRLGTVRSKIGLLAERAVSRLGFGRNLAICQRGAVRGSPMLGSRSPVLLLQAQI